MVIGLKYRYSGLKSERIESKMIVSDLKVGILGGGQLGKMLCTAAADWHLELSVLDASEDFPAAPYCHRFVKGDFRDENDVMNFAKDLDVITIEIEGVNIKALHRLKEMGKTVVPDPDFLDIVRDKGRQNEFYRRHDIPIPAFLSFDSADELRQHISEGRLDFPFVWKSRFEGYDGRGVKMISNATDMNDLPGGPCLSEQLVDIDKELALIISRNARGQKAIYDPVEMVFDSRANLLDHLEFPAAIDSAISNRMKQLAKKIVDAVDFKGLLAIEFFLTKDGDLLVNEVAPRPHNSGHHTIECCTTSQYEQLLRTLLNLPPGDTSADSCGIMFNLLGSPGKKGPAKAEGLDKLFATPGAHLHWYGKKDTKPFRKMGHVLLAGQDVKILRERLKELRKNLKITA